MPLADINQLSIDLADDGKYELAMALALRALEVSPEHGRIIFNLSSFLLRLDRHEEAMAVLSMAEQRLGDAGLFYTAHLRGLIHASGANYDLASEWLMKAVVLGNTVAEVDLALLELKFGRYPSGFARYETRLANGYVPCRQLYAGETLLGRSICLHSEQGVGDTILFSRFVPWLCQSAKSVFWVVKPELVDLFKVKAAQFANLSIGTSCHQVRADSCLFIGSLPFWMGNDFQISDESVMLQRDDRPRSSSVLKVGICWHGNVEMTRNRQRTVPLEVMLQVLALDRVQLFSFQVGLGAEYLNGLGIEQVVTDLQPDISKSWADCARMLGDMDLVITCCTGVAHLAAGLGVKCWVLLGLDSYWPWCIDGETTPWYSSVRLFRMRPSENWSIVLARVIQELKELRDDRSSSQYYRAVESSPVSHPGQCGGSVRGRSASAVIAPELW